MTTPNLINSLVCDDVRVEKNGKHIIIGVYTGNIVPSRLPATLPLTFWFQIGGVKTEETSFEFRGSLSGTEAFGGEFTVSMIDSGEDNTKSELATVHLGPIIVQFQTECDLKFDIRYQGGRWKNAILIPVRLRSSSTGY